MYEYLKGTVTFVSPYYIVIENHGIGYQVAVANPYRYSTNFNQEVLVYLHQVIREDGHTLYGFSDLEAKQLFLRLISVSGIGPKSGLAIMASEDHGGLVHAIESEDATYLTKFPGVGKKTAQQMILDLKGKLGELTMTEAAVLAMETAENAPTTQALDEALEALQALGYSERELKKINKQLALSSAETTDDYLRQGLKLLMKK